MTFIFPYIGKFIIPFDELIFLEWDETTNQMGMSSNSSTRMGSSDVVVPKMIRMICLLNVLQRPT